VLLTLGLRSSPQLHLYLEGYNLWEAWIFSSTLLLVSLKTFNKLLICVAHNFFSWDFSPFLLTFLPDQ
jgi:hypothetical protein